MQWYWTTEDEFYKDVDRALQKSDEFILYYQPIMNMKTREIEGYEALARWQHPEHGFLEPAVFIEGIERYAALQFQFCMYVIDRALQDKCFFPKGFVTVNVSPASLSSRQFTLFLEDAKQANKRDYCDHCKDHQMYLEITERVYISIPQKENFLSSVARLEYGLCFDDFGTGESGLQQVLETVLLLRGTVKLKIKFDRYFTQRLQEPIVRDFVLVLIGAMKRNGIEVVAEGIEDETQFQIVKSLDCDYGQGYFIGKPTSHKKYIWYTGEKKCPLLEALLGSLEDVERKPSCSNETENKLYPSEEL